MSRRHRQGLESSSADHAAAPGSHVSPRETLKEDVAGCEGSGLLQADLPIRRLTFALYAIVGVFMVIQAMFLVWRLGFHGQGLVRTAAFFTLDAEDNVPTFFSSALLISCALLCGLAGQLESPRGHSLRPYWYLLGCVFMFLGADEATQFHEFIGHLIRRIWVHRGFMQWPWVIPYLGFAASVAATCVPFLRRLPRDIARQCVIAGAVYVAGAGGVDMIEGAVFRAIRGGALQLQPLFLALPIIEEPMEMIGIILFITAILRYLAGRADVIRLRVTN